MKSISHNKIENLRKNRNDDILKRLENGESLTSFSSAASWFPPRPIIEKDSSAIKKLYGQPTDTRLEESAQNQFNEEGQAPQKTPTSLRLT